MHKHRYSFYCHFSLENRIYLRIKCMHVTAQLWILMIMTAYCRINTMKYLSGNQEADTSVPSITSYLFCLPTDAPQHERLPAATNDPLFFSGEMINCWITVTFPSLISWLAAPDFHWEECPVCDGRRLGCRNSCSRVGAGLFWMELWINMLLMLFIWKWFIGCLLVITPTWMDDVLC